jgi:hypothetical protein
MALLVLLLGIVSGSSVAPTNSGATSLREGSRQGAVVFPLSISASRRYLVDRRGRPFLITGDAPQALIGNLSVRDAAAYIADRKRIGFNALWVNLLCAKYTGCRDDGTTFDGIKPFTRAGDLSTPNPAYFARADAILRLAARAGIAVFLDPIETGSWLTVLRANGVAKDFAYGQFLGRRYRKFGNIVWLNGNDFQTWKRAQDDDDVVLAVAKGIHSVDPGHLQTVELNYFVSASRDDPRWNSVLGLDLAYTYAPTYAEVLQEYARTPPMPVFMGEAGYEFEQNNPAISYGSPGVLRREEYWTALSGAAGQFYGNHYIWGFAAGWRSHLDTTGTHELALLAHFLGRYPWYRLVPDTQHAVVIAGFGSFTSQGNVASSAYVTTAYVPGGSLALSYLPAGGRVTVDLGTFRGPVSAQWFDPTNGTFRAVPKIQANHGTASYISPARNSGGASDWVLVLQAH